MSVERNDPFFDAAAVAAQSLLQRATASAGRARPVPFDDLLLPDGERLDERTRVAATEALHGVIHKIEREVALRAARSLLSIGAGEAADLLLRDQGTALRRLRAANLLRDQELLESVVDFARFDVLATDLPVAASRDPARPSFVVRLAECPEPEIAAAAKALLERSSDSDGQVDLPEEAFERLVWRVAAALSGDAGTPAEQVCVEAARSFLAERGKYSSLDTVSLRLALALDATREELPDVLLDALGDARPRLFVALLAHAAPLDVADVRAVVLDPSGVLLWLLLASLGLGREAIARIGAALCEADPHRDLERFADDLDALDAVSPDEVTHAVSMLRLPRPFRAARAAMMAGGGR